MLISCDGSDTTTESSNTNNIVYEYKIAYELDGGTNSENNPSGYNSGVSLELGVPTKEGYMFAGWYTDPEFTNFVTEIKEDVTGDITLYAKWADLDSSICFELNKDSYTIIGCNKNIVYLFIPSTYKGLPVTCIGESAFKNFTSLQYVYVPDSVTDIKYYAFENCQSLEKIRLSNKLTEISYRSFSDCISLKTIDLPSSIKKISKESFSFSGLESIVLPDNVELIEYFSFGKCKNLSYVKLSKELNIIEYNAFFGCEALESIIIPAKVTTIGRLPFRDCTLLKSITVEDENTIYKSIDGVLYSKDGKILVCYPQGKTDRSYKIPYGTETVAQEAFYHNNHIVNIDFPNSVKEIKNIFGCCALENLIIPESVTLIERIYGCDSLKSVILSSNIEVIPEYAFGECTSLESVVIPNGVKQLNNWIFYKCTSLKSVVIPESVTVAKYDLFSCCTSLEKVYCEAESKPDSWDVGWARNAKEVVWGYKGE